MTIRMAKSKEVPPRPSQGQRFTIIRWPTERWPEGLGISARDGWNFGLGFWLAGVALMILGNCFVFVLLVAFGVSLGELF